MGNQPRLVEKLGPWTVNPFLDWSWFYSPTEDRIYEQHPDHWNFYSRQATLRQSHFPIFSFQNQMEQDDEPPLDLQRGTVIILQNHQVRLTGYRSAQFQEKQTPATLTERIEQLPPSALWAIADCSFQDEGRDLVQAIIDGTAIGVSDGSFKNAIGTSGWVLEDSLGHRIRGANVIPGSRLDQSSYRGELDGLYAMILMAEQLCLQYSIQSGSIEIGCDGLEALLKSFGDFNLPYNAVDYDMLVAIRVKLKKSPLKWKYRHVKGHQDDNNNIILDHWANLNIEMDLLAKEKRAQEEQTPSPRQWLIEDEPWILCISGVKQTKKFADNIHDFIGGEALCTYWEENGQLPPHSTANVDWDATDLAMRNSPQSRRRWVTKHVVGMCGVGKWMKRWKKKPTDECPRCSQPEDAQHVWLCAHPTANEVWKSALQKLDAWMLKSKTLPIIHTLIIS